MSSTRQQAVAVPPHEVPQGRETVGLPARGLHQVVRAQAEPDGPRAAPQEGQPAVQVQHLPAHLRRLHHHGRAPRPEAPRRRQRHGRLQPAVGRFRRQRRSDWPAAAGGGAGRGTPDGPHRRGPERRGKFHAALRAGRRGKHPSRYSQRLALKVDLCRNEELSVFVL